MIREIYEALKITFKKLKYVGTENDIEWNIFFNNSKDHSIFSRMKERTSLEFKEIEYKLSKGVDLILKKVKKGKIEKPLQIALTYKKSDFKAIFKVVPEEKAIILLTILATDMHTKGAIDWNMNESLETLTIDIDL